MCVRTLNARRMFGEFENSGFREASSIPWSFSRMSRRTCLSVSRLTVAEQCCGFSGGPEPLSRMNRQCRASGEILGGQQASVAAVTVRNDGKDTGLALKISCFFIIANES